MKIEYLVVGTGRSGTTYMAKLLTCLGIPCSHEAIFNLNNSIDINKDLSNRLNGNDLKLSNTSLYDYINNIKLESWVNLKNIKAESSYMAVPYLNNSLLSGMKIIQATRNPLSTISSFVKDANLFIRNNNINIWEKFIYSFYPDLLDISDSYTRCAQFIINWENLILNSIKNKEFIRVQVENINKDKLIKFLDVDKWNNDCDKISKKTNTWKKRNFDITWNDIKNPQKDLLREIYNNWGYEDKNIKLKYMC